MKKLKLITLMALLSASVFAQDLIVTTDNDSLNCKISLIDTEFIRFSYSKENGEPINTLITYDNIASYQLAYFDTPEIPIIQNGGTNEKLKWKIGFRGGYSWRTVGTDGDRDVAPLLHGPHLGMDFTYFLNKFIGLGGMATYYHNSVNNREYHVTQNCLFIGPAVNFRVEGADKRNAFVSECAIGGFSMWEDYTTSHVYSFDLYGTVGFFASAGYERRVNKNLLIGGKASALIANIWLSDYVEDMINASRLNLSMYVAFNTNKK